MPFTTLNNETFQALFNYASIGILITDSKGAIQMANKFIEDQFGYSEAELLDFKVEMLIPPRFKERHIDHREQYSADPHSRPMGLGMELCGLKKNGHEFPVEVSLGHYTIEDRQFTLAFVSDITQRKETEQAIVQLNTHLEEKVKEGTQSLAITVDQLSVQIKETEKKDVELQRANTFLNNIWNHAGAIIIVCDKAGLIQFLNPAAENALGYNADEVVNRHSLSLFYDPEEINSKAVELSRQLNRAIDPGFEVLTTLTQINKNKNIEWHYQRKNGSSFFVSVDITPLKDVTDNTTSYLCIAIDISEKKIAEAELRAALEKEKELNELKSGFVSMASHEFKTPLSAVLSSAYLLSRYTTTEEQVQRDKHIQRIINSVSSLTEILNDFLSVGKIEEGGIRPRFSEFDVKKQVGDVIPEVKHLLKKGQHISYEHTGSDRVFLDPSMLKHIVINLLSNAIKFSNENSSIKVNTENGNDKFQLTVKDHGIGIPKEDYDKLFKQFFRSSNVFNVQGTGLGLHIVNSYVEMMNGKIKFKSEVGKGTTFTITWNNKIPGYENNSNH